MRTARIAVLILLLVTTACSRSATPTAAEQSAAMKLVGDTERLVGVIATNRATAAAAERLAEAARAGAPQVAVHVYSPRDGGLSAMLAFVEHLPKFDALAVIAPSEEDPWPVLSAKTEKKWRRQRDDAEESLYHIKEEWLHWRTFYQPPERVALDEHTVAAVYRPNRRELARLKTLHQGRGPHYLADILREGAKRFPAPMTRADRQTVLDDLLKLPPTPALSAELWSGPVETADGYRVQQLILSTPLHGTVSARLLLPAKDAGRVPGVLALHGHSDLPEDYLRRFAGEELARRGMVVLAPAFPASGKDNLSENDLAVEAVATGTNLMALRVEVCRWFLNVLAQRADVDPARLGVMGHSMGGVLALFVGAAEPGVRATASDLKEVMLETLTRDNPAVGLYVPGLLRLKDWSALAELIRPRPLFQASYGYPDKAALVQFMVDSLGASHPSPSPWGRKIRAVLTQPTSRTLPQALAAAAQKARPPESVRRALGVDAVYEGRDTWSLDDSVCRHPLLGEVRFALRRGTQAKETPRLAIRIDGEPADFLETRPPESTWLVMNPTGGENDVEAPLKLLTINATLTGLRLRKVEGCLAALREAGRLPRQAVAVEAETTRVLESVLAVAASPGLATVRVAPGADTRSPLEPVPGLYGFLRSWRDTPPAWLPPDIAVDALVSRGTPYRK